MFKPLSKIGFSTEGMLNPCFSHVDVPAKDARPNDVSIGPNQRLKIIRIGFRI